MTTIPYFGFWCNYCNKAQWIRGEENFKKYHYKYFGLTDAGCYETHVDCPTCKNKLVLRQPSIWHDLARVRH